MTQILTAACPNFVVQVSDRLVVARQGASIRDHDAIANKTIVYRAADALVTISYSGIAYIGATPTDEWIAQLLYGADLRPRYDDRPSICMGRSANPLRIGHAVKHLHDAIVNLPRAPIDQHGLFLALGGWQHEGRAGVRPIMIELSRIGRKTSIDRAPRRWPSHANFRIGSIGVPVRDGTISDALAPHRNGPNGPPLRPETLEDILANIIRETSSRNKMVGGHLLSVVLMRPDLGISGCRFLPERPHLAQMNRGDGVAFAFPVAHSPWVIGPNLAYPASIEVGHMILNLGGIEFHLHGAPPEKGLAGLSSSLRRPAPPAG